MNLLCQYLPTLRSPRSALMAACGIAALGALLTGCSYVTVSEDPYFDRATYEAHPPRTLAIAPMTNRTSNADMANMVRPALYGAISPLSYKDIELSSVDQYIRAKAMAMNKKPEDLDPWYITQPDLADAVLFGEIEKLSRFFLIFYSHVRVELDLVMVDTNTKKYLYKNHVIATNRQFNLPSSIFGVGSSFVTSLWHMRGEQVKKSIEESAEAVAEKFQATVNDTVTESARIARVEIDLPKKTLREGEKVLIKVKTIPNRTLTFSLGNFDKDRPLVETAPGDYSGFHTVQPGENSNFIYVVVRMRDPAKPREELIFNIDDQAFAIDTIPPPDYELVRWGQTDGKPGIKLEFAPGPLGESRNEPPPVLYYLYRSAAPGKELRMIDKGEKPQFDDPGAQPGAEYDYAVIAEDAAGNRSAPKRGKVTVRGTETELPR